MKTRQEIKALAKDAMMKQRSASVLAILLVWVAGFAGGLFGLIPILGWIASFAISAILSVLAVNLLGTFIKVYNGVTISATDPFSELQVNFFRKWGGTLWMGLWIWLWSLLLIIPGIIKFFSYFMTQNILADCPNVTATDALKLSMRMTDGHKWDLFVLMLSWIGWIILSSLTFGILWIVYVGPYWYATDAGFYIELRDKAIAEGKIRPEELM